MFEAKNALHCPGARVWKMGEMWCAGQSNPVARWTKEGIYTASLRASSLWFCCSPWTGLGPASETPLLLLRLLAVHAGGADRSGVEHAGAGNVYRPGAAGVGNDSPRSGGSREVVAESIDSVLLADVAAAPHAGTNPNADDSDDHDDEENHPLVVVIEPGRRTRGQYSVTENREEWSGKPHPRGKQTPETTRGDAYQVLFPPPP